MKVMKLMVPFTPHLALECLECLNCNETNVWPDINNKALINAKINMIIQVDGKTRDVLVVNKDIEQHVLEELIKSSSKANKHIENKKIIKTIYIKNKIINYLIKN